MSADEAEAAMGWQAGTGPQLPSAPCALRSDPPHGHGQLLWAGAVRRHIAEHAELSPEPVGLLRHRLQVSPRATYRLSAVSLTLPLSSFLIGDDGVVYEGTGWGVAGAHTYGYNRNSTGIAFIGNYVGKQHRASLSVHPIVISLSHSCRQAAYGGCADGVQEASDLWRFTR